ncbi:MAG: hypothetical protein AAFQ17_08120, partial [Pseudomonadota bacterium]
VTLYRPQKHDVLIYDAATGEMALNAGTKGELKLYLATFGEVLFGDAEHFDMSDRFALDPLREKGPSSLVNDTIDAIVAVRLVEIERFWGGAYKEKEVCKATDLFATWREAWPKRLTGGRIDRAVFKVRFEGDRKERTVAILPPGLARYERDSDSDLIEGWLTDQGFCRAAKDEDDDDAVLDDA